MQRSVRAIKTFAFLLIGVSVSAPSVFAGMTQDLADCTAADRTTSADACTRVMNSGRLPRKQRYIGHFNRGWAYYHQGEFDKALADFDRSVSYNSGYADTYLSRAVIQHVRGAGQETISDLDRYLAKKGEVAEARLNRARIFRHRGELKKAFAELQLAANLEPGNAKIIAQRALVLSDLGEAAPALSDARKAVATNDKEAIAHYALALVYFRATNVEEARVEIEKSLVLKERLVIAHALKGEILEKQGDKPGAEASFRRALDITSKSLDAYVAQRAVRDRLGMLAVKSSAQSDTAEKLTPIADKKALRTTECRRFIPDARTTIAIECSR